ncbi:TolC family protein [bacterium]|nr:TolC family protein [bacterium]
MKFGMFVLIYMSIPAAAIAAEPGPARLKELLAEAYANNPNAAAARQTWEAERAKIPAQKTPADPMVGADLWRIGRGKSPKSKNAGQDMYMVRQELPIPAKLSARGKVQYHKALMARYEYDRVVLDLQTDVTAAYYDLWELQESLRIARAHSRIWERVAGVSERQYASGKVMQRDVLRAHVEADRIAVEAANLEERLPAERARVNALLNRPVDSALGRPQAPEVDGMTATIDALDSAAAAANVDLKSADHHIKHATYELKLARLGFIPDFTLGWTRMVENGMPKVYNASALLNLPLYFWKQRAEVRAARADLRHAELMMTWTEKQVGADLRAAAAEVRNAARTAQVYRGSILPRARKNLEVVESGYRAGRAGFLDLLDAQQQLLTEELTLIRVQAAYGKARAVLERVVGSGLHTEMEGVHHE